MAEYRYHHSGLRVASALELPEWAAFAVATGEPADVTIALDPAASPDASRDGWDGTALRFAVPDLGTWSIARGCEIRIAPAPNAAEFALRLFTLGSAWGALGYLRGHAVWHGSAVARGGRALLLSGAAGEGKSTLAAALVARGAALVADDLARVEPGPGAARIHPASTRVKLWGPAVAQLGWQDRVLQRDWFREDKFHCAVPAHSAPGPALPLAALVVLAQGETVELTRLHGGEGVAALLAATTYRPDMLAAMALWPQQVGLAAAVAAQCPVYRLTKPKDFGQLDCVCALLEDLLGIEQAI